MIPPTPEAVKDNFRLGLKLYEMGLAGSGLVDKGKDNTVDWARRIVKGERITPEKARKMKNWLKRHGAMKREADARIRQEKDFIQRIESGERLVKMPAWVSFLLWGVKKENIGSIA
jgi:hypothetical protein